MVFHLYPLDIFLQNIQQITLVELLLSHEEIQK